MEVNSTCTFRNLLVIFDILSRQDTYALYNDLMHGRLLYSDIAAIRKRIITTHKFNIVNLGARFLYFFFQAFKTILWIDYNDRISVWKSLHNISK